MDCSECQHHYSQNGKCIENKNNCLYYLEEPRGKMLRSNFSFTILADAETPVIKPGAIINIEENGRVIELKVIRINWINLDTMTCNIEAFYHEGNGEASFGVAGEDWERIEITEPPYKYSGARFYAEYYNGFQAPFLVCIWNKDYAELEDILKNTSEKLYKAYRKEMEWDMTYERLDKNLHSVAKGLGEFYLNGTR